MKFIKFFIAIIVIVFLAGCENMVHYEGIIVDNQNDSCIKNVNVLVIMNNTVQDQYGIIILDTILMTKRDSLRRLKIKDNFSMISDVASGKYIRNEPFTSDSLGRFSISLHEGCPFGCPDYDIRFVKKGYQSFQFKGDWNTNKNLVIRLKRK